MKWFNRLVVRILPFFPKPFIWIFSKRYIAGLRLPEALEKTRILNADQILATIDVLGEDITELTEAALAREQCIETIRMIAEEQLHSGVSIKLTQLGLCIDMQECYRNVEKIVETARKHRVFVRIDMEDSTTTDQTLSIYRDIRKKYTQVGTVVQAYLLRTKNDVQQMIDEGICNIRLCKGIYDESPDIAIKDADGIRDNFMILAEMSLRAGEFTALATHDKILVDRSSALLEKLHTDPSKYEFQMLLGVTEQLRSKITEKGHKMRVYVPYGEQWYGYCMRRMKENPQVAGHVIKNLLIRN